jgi:hypothetical protein
MHMLMYYTRTTALVVQGLAQICGVVMQIQCVNSFY